MKNTNQLTVSMDIEEAQMQLAQISWQYRWEWSWYRKISYMTKALQVLVCLLIFAIPTCIAMKNTELLLGCILLFILSVLGIVKIPKSQKERFFRTYRNGAEKVIERNGTNLISYQISEEGIVKTGRAERRIEWSNIKGYFREEGWLGLFLVEHGKSAGFIMIPEETLEENECIMLHGLLEQYVKEKDVDWKKLYS